jgi:uncharacterized repeat protein (TIGR03803 family)
LPWNTTNKSQDFVGDVIYLVDDTISLIGCNIAYSAKWASLALSLRGDTMKTLCVALQTLASCAAAAVFVSCSGAPLTPSPRGVTAAQTPPRVGYFPVYHFGNGSEDGENPRAALINVNGTLYGTTAYGGTSDYGTVFYLTPSGTEMRVYSFKGGSADGGRPEAPIVKAKGGFYGTTELGGANGYGTVYVITPSGAETVLHSFGSTSADGEGPLAGVVNVNGTLYGTTAQGGANGFGTVYAVTPSGAETVLHSFGSTSGDGELPVAGLVNVKGTLYGTTAQGGANGYGTVYAITPSGTETVLHSFGSSSQDGKNPLAGLIEVKGAFDGTTSSGGAHGHGTVFALKLSGAETVLYSFKGGSKDGAYPDAALLYFDGKLYGTTYAGGINKKKGTIFVTTTSGAESVLHKFSGGSQDGELPVAGLVNLNGTLYGTTVAGGGTGCYDSSGCGTAFALNP